MTVRATIRYFDGCPSWQTARDRLTEAASRSGVDLELDLEPVETLEAALSRPPQRGRVVGSNVGPSVVGPAADHVSGSMHILRAVASGSHAW